MKPYKWLYQKEKLILLNSGPEATEDDTWEIGNVSEPRNVFMWFVNGSNLKNQEKNPFIFNTHLLLLIRNLYARVNLMFVQRNI